MKKSGKSKSNLSDFSKKISKIAKRINKKFQKTVQDNQTKSSSIRGRIHIQSSPNIAQNDSSIPHMRHAPRQRRSPLMEPRQPHVNLETNDSIRNLDVSDNLNLDARDINFATSDPKIFEAKAKLAGAFSGVGSSQTQRDRSRIGARLPGEILAEPFNLNNKINFPLPNEDYYRGEITILPDPIEDDSSQKSVVSQQTPSYSSMDSLERREEGPFKMKDIQRNRSQMLHGENPSSPAKDADPAAQEDDSERKIPAESKKTEQKNYKMDFKRNSESSFKMGNAKSRRLSSESPSVRVGEREKKQQQKEPLELEEVSGNVPTGFGDAIDVKLGNNFGFGMSPSYDPYKNGLINPEINYSQNHRNQKKSQTQNEALQNGANFAPDPNNPLLLFPSSHQGFKSQNSNPRMTNEGLMMNPSQFMNGVPNGTGLSQQFLLNIQNPMVFYQVQSMLMQNIFNSLMLQDRMFFHHLQNNLNHPSPGVDQNKHSPGSNLPGGDSHSMMNPALGGAAPMPYSFPMGQVNPALLGRMNGMNLQQMAEASRGLNPHFFMRPGPFGYFPFGQPMNFGQMNPYLANSENKKQFLRISKKSKDKFAKLENLLKKIFLMETVKAEDLDLDQLEKWIFEKVIDKKKYFLICGVVWKDTQFFDELKASTTPKRNEEKLKYVFKMTQKKLKKKFFQNYYNYCNECADESVRDRLRSDKEFAFFHFYFHEYCRETGVSLAKIIQASGNERVEIEKNKKKNTKAIKSVNRDYLRLIKGNEKFMSEFKKYILFDCEDITRVEDTHNSIVGDSHKTIQKKIENKIVEWTTMWYNSDKRNEEFKQVIESDFNKKKYKLPWTMVDVYSAVDEVRQIIREESDGYIPETFE